MKGKKPIILLVVAVVIIVAVIVGVMVSKNGNNGNSMSGMPGMSMGSNQAQAVATNSVKIHDYAFSPATITVKVGTKVTWTNTDQVDHTVTADSGTGPNSQLFGQGQTYSYTFTKAGTYSYHCMPHPYMNGTVIVTQ